jgi:hypothetical protein
LYNYTKDDEGIEHEACTWQKGKHTYNISIGIPMRRMTKCK